VSYFEILWMTSAFAGSLVVCAVAMIALDSFMCAMFDLLLSSWRSGVILIIVSLVSLSILLWVLVV
jgi:hypothetical protein